jgi:hypothetical protein
MLQSMDFVKKTTVPGFGFRERTTPNDPGHPEIPFAGAP